MSTQTIQQPGGTLGAATKLILGSEIHRADISKLNWTDLIERVNDVFRIKAPPGGAQTKNLLDIKYLDEEGDLVSITSDEELQLAQRHAQHGDNALKLYLMGKDAMTANFNGGGSGNQVLDYLIAEAKRHKDKKKMKLMKKKVRKEKEIYKQMRRYAKEEKKQAHRDKEQAKKDKRHAKKHKKKMENMKKDYKKQKKEIKKRVTLSDEAIAAYEEKKRKKREEKEAKKLWKKEEKKRKKERKKEKKRRKKEKKKEKKAKNSRKAQERAAALDEEEEDEEEEEEEEVGEASAPLTV